MDDPTLPGMGLSTKLALAGLAAAWLAQAAWFGYQGGKFESEIRAEVRAVATIAAQNAQQVASSSVLSSRLDVINTRQTFSERAVDKQQQQLERIGDLQTEVRVVSERVAAMQETLNLVRAWLAPVAGQEPRLQQEGR